MNSIDITFALILLIDIITGVINPNASVGPVNLGPAHAKVGDFEMNMQSCGLTKQSKGISGMTTPVSRIINGEKVDKISEFPWFASLHDMSFTSDSFLCGAVLIHRYWLLTAKHCLIDGGNPISRLSDLRIYLGSIHISRPYLTVGVQTYFIHEFFDFAIIRVNQPIDPIKTVDNKYIINYICIPVPNIENHVNENALLAGFGFLDAKKTKRPYTLRKAVYTIDSVEQCKISLQRPEHFICVYHTNQSTCSGDSGSALAQWDGDRAVVVGTVQGGKSVVEGEICGPGQLWFVRVSKFVDWFRNFIITEMKGTTQPTHTVQITSTTNIKPSDPDSSNNNSYDVFRYDMILFIAFILNILV